MAKIETLRKKIGDKKQNKGGEIDPNQVEKIVERMKKKYRKEGVEFEQVGGKLGELRGIIADNEQAKINVQTVEDLKETNSAAIKNIGRIYLLFKFPLDPITKLLKNLPVTSDIRYYLYSANMKYSLTQWLAISLITSLLMAGMVFTAMAAFFIITEQAELAINVPAILSIIIPASIGFFTLLIMFLIPKSKAQRRGEAISVELPFALRHMATELKAGIGLYKTLQTIATSDYGILSEEFARTINEIEEGTDTKDALRHFALRTQSKSLRNALFHIVRAIKTGGNLSDIMNTIAEDVSFDMRVKIKDFAERMNFFGIIYIFIAIVMPVFIAIIGSVTNAPIELGGLYVPPLAIAGIYFVGMPLILGFLVFYLKIAQPKV